MKMPSFISRWFASSDDRSEGGDFWFEPVTVRTSSRAGIFECLVAPPGAEAVFGRIPLSRLDLHVDPVQQQLVVRPESPIYPLYSVK